MERKKKSLLTAITTLVLFLGLGASPQAQVSLGVKTAPGIFYMPLPSTFVEKRWEQIAISLGTSYSYVSGKEESKENGSLEYWYKMKSFNLTPYFGLKVFLKKGDISPYLYGEAGRQFPLSVTWEDSTGRDKEEEKLIKDQSDWLHFVIAAGLEYSLTTHIVVGAEMGIRWYYNKYVLERRTERVPVVIYQTTYWTSWAITHSCLILQYRF